jgi:hypothetical protein
MEHQDQWDSDELAAVAARLRGARPEANPLELDQIKLRAQRQAARNPRRGSFMKSRLAMALVLTVGMLFSMTGAGLAISGSSSSGSAATAQYPPNDPPKDPKDPKATIQAKATGSLPFTGYAAVPILLIGVVLLGTGFVLRRRTEDE